MVTEAARRAGNNKQRNDTISVLKIDAAFGEMMGIYDRLVITFAF